MVNLRYNGNRFPRAVILNGHRKEVFHPIKRVIAFENSDAYMILKYNSRLNPNLWEFDIVDEVPEVKLTKTASLELKPIIYKHEDIEKLSKLDKPTEPEKPVKVKKAMEPMRTLKPKQSKRGR